ncbi:MAG: indole-3-glycerol phosphate synthase TrpC [Fermentimonas sp.]|nr:indole-3-glycerol phosphate synthase TrpC [Fermentimonas sp.]HBT84357.1 indole-3-glycerol phosphate synthase TrpC [Porphyromonadaceae bacterium]MDD2930218.1 indole-3-glycerol phosphate synthase TrpC [Fermentimonas sp.]MDD3188081.1 indole-3-glycerol phosphate synthase TrpC [Fermentimonas sp.]MDD4284129.1 indole-3-glycerol phosphate synthase TrpC [Fermentimonas sp.]
MRDVLSEIVAHKRIEVERQKELVPLSEIEKQLSQNRDIVFHSLKGSLERSKTGIISEFKRRSPSKGWLHQDADVNAITKEYEIAGASALSVLTDEKYFGGTITDLRTAVNNVQIPVMRKEFVVDEYQIYEAKLAGASAILLIAAAITLDESKRFTELAQQLKLDVLLELHDEKETDYITPLNNLIGVNNRNLGSFVTDLQKSFRMAELLPKEAVWVSESGISDANTVKELRDAGYKGFLIGEYFMKSGSPGESLSRFIQQIEMI